MLTRKRATQLCWSHLDLVMSIYEETASIKAVHREELFDTENSYYNALNEDLKTVSDALGQDILHVIRAWETECSSPERIKSHGTLNMELEALLTDELLATAPGEKEGEEYEEDGPNEPDPECGF